VKPLIAGLDPAIHLFPKMLLRRLMDARIKSGHDERVCRLSFDLVQALQKPAHVTASVYRTERNTIANTTSQPTMTNDATAPAVILAFSLVL
jgi:hypothetical protein